MNPPVVPLEPQAFESLCRTRAWIFLLAIVTAIACVLCGIFVIAGIIGLGANRTQAHAFMAAGNEGLAAGLPIGYFQFSYAMALSDVAEAPRDDLNSSIERACVRQRNLWIATAVLLGLTVLFALFQTLDLFLF